MGEYSWINAKPDISLETIFQTNKRFSFLVGSGVSFGYPSCQPTGLQFTKMILSFLLPENQQQLVLELTDPNSFGKDRKNKFLRFEQLMEHIQEWDPDLNILDNYAFCKTPNSNHTILAMFIAAGHRVFTTNFDNLIEHALAEIKILQENIQPVIFPDDWTLKDSKGKCYIYKLHGSLIDFRNNKNSRDSLKATIRQISRNKEQSFLLEYWKRTVLETALTEDDLVTLGYSGSDDFDILPTIESTKSTKRIIWINHDNKYSINNAKIEMLVNSGGRMSNDRADHFLSSITNVARSPANILKISIDTMELLGWLAKKFFNQTISKDEQPCPAFNIQPSSELKLSAAEKWYLCGSIYSYFDTQLAVNFFNQSLKLAKHDGNELIEAQCLIYLARQYESLLYCYEIGSAERKNCFVNSLVLNEKALEIFKTQSNRKYLIERARVLNNIGSVYRSVPETGYIKKSADYYKQSLKVSLELKDPEGQSAAYNNIGVAEYALDIDSSINNFELAVKIDREHGYFDVLVVHLGNLGKIYCDKGDVKGTAYLNEAVEIGKQIGDNDMVANNLNSLGSYYATNSNLKMAETCYSDALEFIGQGNVELAKSIKRSLEAVKVAQQMGLKYLK